MGVGNWKRALRKTHYLARIVEKEALVQSGLAHHLDEPRHARPRVVALLDLEVAFEGLQHGSLLVTILFLLREAAGLALLVE